MGFAFILTCWHLNCPRPHLRVGRVRLLSHVVKLGLPGFAAFPLTVLAAAAFGVLVERFLFRPMKADFNRTIMICIALSTILVTTFNRFMGTRALSIPPFIPGTTGIGPYKVETDRILAFCIGIVILVAIFCSSTAPDGGQVQRHQKGGRGMQGIRSARSRPSPSPAFWAGRYWRRLHGHVIQPDAFVGDVNYQGTDAVILAGLGSFNGILCRGYWGALRAMPLSSMSGG